MGFVFNEHRKAGEKPPRRSGGTIPIHSMAKLGCAACPRDRDTELRSPKMPPEGRTGARVYLLSNRPTQAEDRDGRSWSGPAGREVLSKFSRGFVDKHVRLGHIAQCAPPDADGHKHVDQGELECCRPRVVSDIEETRPLIVVGVGDEPLHWATGLNRNALAFRGTLIATRIGGHACWYYPILYPNYTASGGRKQGKREFELTLEHDIAEIEDMSDNAQPPRMPEGPLDGGIELITGQDEGDWVRLEEALHWLTQQKAVGFDIETNGLKPVMMKDPKIWTAAMGTFERTVAFAVEHPDGWGTETRTRRAVGMLGELISQTRSKRCHNLAFEMEWSAHFFGNQILRRTEWDDTMAMAYVLDERKGTKSLDVQTRIEFGFFLKDLSRVDVSRPDWVSQYPIRDTLRYNGLDAKWTDRLFDARMLDFVSEGERLWQVYQDRVRLAPTLVLTTERGLPADLDYARRMLGDLERQVEKVEQRIRKTPEVREYTSRFGTFEATNNDHVLKLMDVVLQRPEVTIEDYAGNESKSTKEEVLAKIPASEAPSAALILEHRGLMKCDSTYVRPIIEGTAVAADGKIHAEYQSLHTVTSRLNSEMHNWPKHKYREVRGIIAAPEDQWIVAADMGQIEFRVAGMLSEDENIIKYSWTGYDVHKFWAERMVAEYPRIKDWIVDEFKVDWDDKGLKTLRQAAKNGWVFPQLFGATTESCAGRMHIPADIAADLGAEFWDEFRGAKRWQERTVEFYEKNLYVETLGGFRRRGPTTRNELINMPIQGTACEIVLASMNDISEEADLRDDPELQPAFNGHDDLSFIISDANLDGHIKYIVGEMCRPRFDYINVPLIVEVSVGARWHELQEIGKYSSEQVYSQRNPYR